MAKIIEERRSLCTYMVDSDDYDTNDEHEWFPVELIDSCGTAQGQGGSKEDMATICLKKQCDEGRLHPL